MVLIEWKDEFSLGVPSIDHEHRELIELINESYDHVAESNSNIAIQVFLGEIYAKISAHFALEEKLMKEINYDQYDEHKQDHEILLGDILDIMDECDQKTLLDEKEFSERLTPWFTEHFKTKDARLHKHLDTI